MVKIWDLWGLSGVWFCGAGADLIWRGVIFERKSTVLEGGLGWGLGGLLFFEGEFYFHQGGGRCFSFGRRCFIWGGVLYFYKDSELFKDSLYLGGKLQFWSEMFLF